MRTAQEEARGHSQVLTESAGAKTQDVLVTDTAPVVGDERSACGEDRNHRQETTRWAFLIGAATFGATMPQTGLLRLPFQNLLKSNLNASPEGMASFFALTALAWYFKPVAGILVDNVPLLGTRRRHYLILSAVLTSVFFLLAGFLSHTYVALLVVLIAANAMLAVGSTVVGGLTVEAGQSNGSTGRLTSALYVVSNGCLLMSGPLGGFLAMRAFQFTAAACALISLSAVPFAWWFLREPTVRQQGSETWIRAKSQFFWLLRSRTAWTAAGLLFLVYTAPGFLTPLYYFQTDTLKFSQEFIGTLILLGGLFGIGGSLLYAFLCRRIRLRWLLYLGIAGSAMGSLTYLFYRSGSAAAIIESQNGMISAFVTLALMDLAARATPRGSEALGFAIMMSILNVAQSLSDVFGSWLIDHLHFTFFRLVWLNAATTALVLVLIPLVPRLLLDRTDTTPA